MVRQGVARLGVLDMMEPLAQNQQHQHVMVEVVEGLRLALQGAMVPTV